jgi:hypothetical protein
MLGRLFFLEGKNVLIGYFCGAWEKWFNRGINGGTERQTGKIAVRHMLGRLFFLEGKNVLIGYFCGAWGEMSSRDN